MEGTDVYGSDLVMSQKNVPVSNVALADGVICLFGI